MSRKSGENLTARRKVNLGELYSKYGMFVILFAMMAIGAVLSENFLTSRNLLNILKQNSYLLVMAFGTTFVMVIGCINIAYDSIMTLIGCSTALVFLTTQNFAVTLLVLLALGVLVGYVYGGMVTFLNLPPFIVGLAVASICEGLTILVTKGQIVNGLNGTAYTVVGQGKVGGVPNAILVMLVFMAVTWFLLRLTKFGRYAIAVGGNKKAAIVAGVRANRIIRLVYILDGVTAAVAGFMFMSRLGAGQPAPGTGYGFDAITGVVIGGASLSGGSGGAVGTFIGVMVVALLTNIMNLLHLSSYYQMIAKGVLIVIAVVVDMKTKRASVRAGMKG